MPSVDGVTTISPSVAISSSDLAASGPVLLSDPRVRSIPVHDNEEPLVALPAWLDGSAHGTVVVRRAVAIRLGAAARLLPAGLRLRVLEAYRDLTVTDDSGRELDLGCPVDATPEQSAGCCYLGSPDVPGPVRAGDLR